MTPGSDVPNDQTTPLMEVSPSAASGVYATALPVSMPSSPGARMIWWVGAGLAGWLLFWWVVDTPVHPAWQVRNAYRWLTVGLVILLGVTAGKALLWHQELVFTLRQCP